MSCEGCIERGLKPATTSLSMRGALSSNAAPRLTQFLMSTMLLETKCENSRWKPTFPYGRPRLNRAPLLALCIATVIAGGCKVGPKYVRPPVDQPASFKSEHSDIPAPLIEPEWWRLYNDSELDQLIASAHASNQTLRQAVASVDEARAIARVARGFLYPSISFNP